MTKLRKPQWLELNLDNPFRDWDGRESIRPPVAKGAFKAYLEAKKTIVDASGPAEAEKAIEAFILRLNRLATRSPLETMERDEVMRALRALGQRGGVLARRVEELFETLEDF